MKSLKVTLWFLPVAVCVLHVAFPSASAQPTRPTPGQPSAATDITLVKRLIAARREYQHSLEQLHNYYESVGDAERRRWAEAELMQYHRVPKAAYIMDLDVAGPGL